jgi:hypothetical protein
MRPEVADLLTTLDREEREELRLELSRKKVRHDALAFSARDEMLWRACLVAYAKHREWLPTSNLHIAARKIGIAKYKQATTTLFRILGEACSTELNNAQLNRLTQLAVDCCLYYRLRRGLSADLGTLTLNMERILPEALDEAFPAYAISKNLHTLVAK